MNDSTDNNPQWTAHSVQGRQIPAKSVGSTTVSLMPDDSAIRRRHEPVDGLVRNPLPGTTESGNDSLLSRSGVSRSQPGSVSEKSATKISTGRPSGGIMMVGLVGFAMLLVLGLGVLVSAVLTSGSTEAIADPEQTPSGDLPASNDPESSDSADTGLPGVEAPADELGSPESNTVAGARSQSTYARLEGLSLFLEGTVPSQEIGDKVEARAAELLGQPAVRSNYTVDPDATLPDNPPLFASSTVLFEPDGTVNVGSAGTLNLAFSLLIEFPDAYVIVTTPLAPELEAGQVAATETQATGVMNFWIDKGLDPSRVKVEVPSLQSRESDAEQVVEREIEFIVRGLLASN